MIRKLYERIIGYFPLLPCCGNGRCLPVSGGPLLPVAKVAGICYGLHEVLPAPSGTAGRHGLTKEDIWQR